MKTLHRPIREQAIHFYDGLTPESVCIQVSLPVSFALVLASALQDGP